jgi:hypothetical protein
LVAVATPFAARLGFYQFQIGSLIQLAPDTRAYMVIWRGQQPSYLSNGGIIEQNIYRLDDGFWDCYHEEELQAAWQ